VERAENSQVRMMLTSQVFAIMSKTAQKDQIESICKSADKYLFDRQAGGYRLNTNFHEEKFDLGRMFGFAYGEKENGAVFSHMAVMYGNALYKNGYAKEGHKVLETLLDAAMDFENSRMYPGIPEYFDNQGRGLYAYLTGAASWYMLTMITEVFGVRGDLGDLVIAPALMPEQYNENGQASLTMEFAGRKLEICICNPEKKLPSEYKIKTVWCDEKEMKNEQSTCVRIDRELLEKLSVKETHRIKVELM
jgi:cellobiose phosphorylase